MPEHDHHEDDDVPVLEPAIHCGACGGTALVRLGQMGVDGLAYFAREDEGKMIYLGKRIRPQLRLCLDCGLVMMFAEKPFRDEMRERYH